jgi:hypothetical protein
MKRTFWSRRVFPSVGALAVAVGAVVVAVTPGISGAAPSAASQVLSPTYAKSIGFPKTLQAAKKVKVTSEKGCTQSTQAVYENTTTKTGLISETLQCTSKTAASAALSGARKQATVDTTVKAPKQLGSSAFVTASDAPEYLLVWQNGTRVGITAVDVDVVATESTSASPLSTAQAKKLGNAAVKQNSLYR